MKCDKCGNDKDNYNCPDEACHGVSASDSDELLCCENTDKEIWREKDDDFYSPSIHVTEDGKIGINVGGRVFVKDIRGWHSLAT